MKKISVFGFILVATATQLTFAAVQTQGECPMAFQGFHLGGNIGYGVGWNKQKFHWVDSNFNASSTLAVKGVDGGLGVGYTHRLCSWAVGLVFDANWSGAEGQSKVSFPQFFGQPTQAHAKIRIRNSLQLYAKLGYVIREIAQPFIALGWDNSQWKETATINVGPFFSAHAGKSKRVNAFMWKAGVDLLATRYMVFGLEYTGTIAPRQKFSVSPIILGQPNTLSGSFRPQYNKFALTARVIY